MKYIAVLNENEEGCDYTIHCGTLVIEFEAENMAAAIEYCKTYNGESSMVECYGAFRIDSCNIYEVSNVFDFLKLHVDKVREKEEAAAIQSEKDAIESRKKQYEVLKAEFE